MNVATILVRSPATLETIAELPAASAKDVANAVARARKAQPAWSALSFTERAGILVRFRDLLIDQQERLADVLTSETGKPRAEVYENELFYVCDAIQYFTKNAERLLAPKRIRPHLIIFKGKQVFSLHHPDRKSTRLN